MELQTLEELKSGKLLGSKQLKLRCGLTAFPREIFMLEETLELLDLSGNQLSCLPDDFDRLKNLKILFLSDNQFAVFPEVLGKCESLSMIGIKANQIHTIAETALPIQTRWLILTNNQLTALPKSIGKCHNMQKLALAGNQLKELPVELSNCKNLGLLRISANQLQQFQEWLLAMPKLSWLAFAGNPFCYGPTIHSDLAEVEWNDLNILQQLGEGASGIISKAVWKQPNNETKEVAVKVFKGDVTSDGLPEDEMDACILAGNHTGLIEVIGKLKNNSLNIKGLVLELIPPAFHNLGLPPSFETCTRDVFNASTHFTTAQIIRIASCIAGAAAHLHEKGILHGDLYAHNILVNKEAESLLGDFGAATIYDTDTAIADGLERIEVLAFGCLLEDLLTCLHADENNNHLLPSLLQLKQAAMQPTVNKRPSFAQITKTLNRFII